MVARTLSGTLKGKLPLPKIWNKNSASFRANNSEEHKKNVSKGGAPPTNPKSKRPRACRLKTDEVEGIVFVRKCDLQVGPLLGEGGFAQVFGLFNPPSLLETAGGDKDGKESVVSMNSAKENEDTPISAASDDESTPGPEELPTQQKQEQQQHQQYAVKTIRKGLLEDKVMFEKAANDLVNEAEILARLDHRCIIKMRGVSKDADRPINHPQRYSNFFILLDRLSETLSDRIQFWKDFEDKKPSLDIKVSYSYQLAQALEYLHQKRIIFRDLKPENIGFKGTMAQNDHMVQLFDFGMARELPSTSSTSAPPLPPKRPPKAGESYQQLSTATTPVASNTSSSSSSSTSTVSRDEEEFFHLTICGTQRYMSPEVLLHGKYSLKSDCYTWAMVVWEIIAEAKPFHFMTPSVHKILVCKQGDRPPLSCYGLPATLQELLKTSWAHKVADRIPMAAVCEKLKPCVQELPSSPPASIQEVTPGKHHRRSSSHGVFDSFRTDTIQSEPNAQEVVVSVMSSIAAPAAPSTPEEKPAPEEKNKSPSISPPKSRISPSCSHGSFLNNLQNALRSPLADIPPAKDEQQKNAAAQALATPPRSQKSKGSFLSPPSSTPTSRLPPPKEFTSPKRNRRNLNQGVFLPHIASADDVSASPDAVTKSSMLNSWPAPPKAHRRNNSQSSTASKSSNSSLISRISLGDLASAADDQRASFLNSKPALGKVPRNSGASLLTRIARVPHDLSNSNNNSKDGEDEEPPAPVLSPYSERKKVSPSKDAIGNISFLTNKIITRITRIPVEDPAPEADMTSPGKHHRRSSSQGSYLFSSDNNNNSGHQRALFQDQSLEEQMASMPLVSLKSSSWDAKNGPSLAELQDRKKDLKEQLKQYDICFAQAYGRMPNKAEKEQIRPMYDHYNKLKIHITSLETLKNRLKQYDKCFAKKHGRMPNKAEKEIIRPWYDQYKALKNGIAGFLMDYENSRGAQEAQNYYERVVGQRNSTYLNFHSFDSDMTPEIEVAEL